MIGILGGMGTQAGLDFCNKLAKINAGKLDQRIYLDLILFLGSLILILLLNILGFKDSFFGGRMRT